MKNTLLVTLLFTLITSCSDKMDMNKATKLIEAHPFLSEYHVGVTSTEYKECEHSYVGTAAKGYFHPHGSRRAYYYKMNNFKLNNVSNLAKVSDEEFTCIASLSADNLTSATEYLTDVRPKAGTAEMFIVQFTKDKEKGWQITDFCSTNYIFKINIWRDEFIYNITPTSFSPDGELIGITRHKIN